jgi:hypothetical protein
MQSNTFTKSYTHSPTTFRVLIRKKKIILILMKVKFIVLSIYKMWSDGVYPNDMRNLHIQIIGNDHPD